MRFLLALIFLIASALPTCRAEMREHIVTINHDGMLNFPNPTEIHNLNVAILLDSSLASYSNTSDPPTLNYDEIVNEFLVAHNFFDPTLRFTIVLRVVGSFNFMTPSGSSFVNMCSELGRDRDYSPQVDFTIIFTPHMPTDIMGWGVHNPDCIAIQASRYWKPSLLTLIHEVGHAIRGLHHSDKPSFNCLQFTLPSHIETCQKLWRSVRIIHVMYPFLPSPTLNYTNAILGDNILTPPNIVFMPGRLDNSVPHVAPLEFDTEEENSQRFSSNFAASVNLYALRNFCSGPPAIGFIRCEPTRFTPLYELSSGIIDRYVARGRNIVKECTIGNRTHVCLAGYPFERNRMDQQVHYSKWSAWTEWREITVPKNTVYDVMPKNSPFLKLSNNETESRLRVWTRQSNCVSYDANGKQVPHDSLFHKCFSLARFQYVMNSTVTSWPIEKTIRPSNAMKGGICSTETQGHYMFPVKDQECWQHCRKTKNDDRNFIPRMNGVACNPRQITSKTTYYSGFCLAGVCVSQTSPSVQQLAVVPISERFYNISAADLIAELRSRGKFVKSIMFLTSEHVATQKNGPSAIFRERQFQCDVVCLARAFESMLRWPDQVFPQIRVTYYKTPKANVRRLLDHCVHLSGHLVRCATVCLITLASDNIRMISPHECAAFSIQLSFIFGGNGNGTRN